MKTPFTVGRHILLGTPVILDATGSTLAVMSQPDEQAATLLAAAPELLETLQEVCRQYQNVRDANGYEIPSMALASANDLLSRLTP